MGLDDNQMMRLTGVLSNLRKTHVRHLDKSQLHNIGVFLFQLGDIAETAKEKRLLNEAKELWETKFKLRLRHERVVARNLKTTDANPFMLTPEDVDFLKSGQIVWNGPVFIVKEAK